MGGLIKVFLFAPNIPGVGAAPQGLRALNENNKARAQPAPFDSLAAQNTASGFGDFLNDLCTYGFDIRICQRCLNRL